MSEQASEATGIVPDGRYPRRTPERAIAVAAALRAGATRTAAAARAGLDQNTFWRWMKDDAAFVELVEKAEAEAEMVYLTRFFQAAQDPADWRAAASWLERRRSASWGRGRRVNGVAVKTESEDIESEQRARGIVRDRRYPRRTPERASAIATALRAGATRAAAMRHADLDQNTFWRWRKADAAFLALVEQAEAEAEMACVTTIHRAAQDPAN